MVLHDKDERVPVTAMHTPHIFGNGQISPRVPPDWPDRCPTIPTSWIRGLSSFPAAEVDPLGHSRVCR